MGFNCGIVGLPNVGKSTIFSALTAVQAMPGRLECIVDLSKTYREAGDYASAIRVLLDNLPTVTRKADFRDVIRGYWYEWSVCFGLSGKGASSAASNAAFAGVALSDAVGDVPLGSEQAMRICSGIGLAFGRLSEKVGSVVFARGRSASAWIGSHSSPDAKAEQFFRQHEAASLRMGVPLPTDIDEAVDWLREAIVESVRYIEDARLAGLIELDSMGFQGLRRVLERSRAK